MIKSTKFLAFSLLLSAASWLSFSAAATEQMAFANPQQHPHIEVELVSEKQHWLPGQVNWLGLAMRPEAHWHTYWKNPGESGLATTLSWRLPEQFQAGEISWPFPHAIDAAGIINYGYEGNSLLMVPIKVPDNLSENSYSAVLSASWLVCKEVCIPGSADLQLTLPVSTSGSSTATPFAALFDEARMLLPTNMQDSQVYLSVAGADAVFRFTSFSAQAEGELQLFASEEELLKPSAPTRWNTEGGNLVARQQLSDYFSSPPESTEVVVSEDGQTAYQFIANSAELDALPVAAAPAGSQTSELSLPVLLMMAMLGGLLLNLMPCVFPVLALKAVSLMKLSGKDKRDARMQGWLYLAGIEASLVLLAGLLVLLQQSGAAVGWGFQLQEPLFLAALAGLMFLMGLSLMGAFEIGGAWMSLGQARIDRGGHSASFLSGCLAVVVASPCMTPLMAPALGAALSLPPLSMTAVLLALGFGLALPMWVFSMFPKLAGYLPRSGPWLNTFKQAMSFPLFLTGIWLIWLLQSQQPELIAWTMLAVLLLGFLIWLRQHAFNKLGIAMGVSTIALLVWFLLPTFTTDSQSGALADRAVPYSEAKLKSYQQQGKPVLVNMTADWCITCKVNERLTFSTQIVADAFQEHGITYVVGDWTQRDTAISEFLNRYQHAGVPLYVLFDGRGNEQVLPQILTPNLLIEALDAAVTEPDATLTP